MKLSNLLSLFLISAIVFFSCSKDSEIDQEQMVYLNNELTALSSIDQSDDQLSILFVDDEDPLGRFFTDEIAMEEWLSLKQDGDEIKKAMDLEKDIKNYFINNDLYKLQDNPEKFQIEMDKYFNSTNQTRLLGFGKLKMYTKTGFNGTNKTYLGPVLKPFLGEGLDNNYESFKAWATSASGILTFYDKKWFNGSSKTYWVPFYKKRANLGSFNNKTSSLSYVAL